MLLSPILNAVDIVKLLVLLLLILYGSAGLGTMSVNKSQLAIVLTMEANYYCKAFATNPFYSPAPNILQPFLGSPSHFFSSAVS